MSISIDAQLLGDVSDAESELGLDLDGEQSRRAAPQPAAAAALPPTHPATKSNSNAAAVSASHQPIRERKQSITALSSRVSDFDSDADLDLSSESSMAESDNDHDSPEPSISKQPSITTAPAAAPVPAPAPAHAHAPTPVSAPTPAPVSSSVPAPSAAPAPAPAPAPVPISSPSISAATAAAPDVGSDDSFDWNSHELDPDMEFERFDDEHKHTQHSPARHRVPISPQASPARSAATSISASAAPAPAPATSVSNAPTIAAPPSPSVSASLSQSAVPPSPSALTSSNESFPVHTAQESQAQEYKPSTKDTTAAALLRQREKDEYAARLKQQEQKKAGKPKSSATPRTKPSAAAAAAAAPTSARKPSSSPQRKPASSSKPKRSRKKKVARASRDVAPDDDDDEHEDTGTDAWPDEDDDAPWIDSQFQTQQSRKQQQQQQQQPQQSTSPVVSPNQSHSETEVQDIDDLTQQMKALLKQSPLNSTSDVAQPPATSPAQETKLVQVKKSERKASPVRARSQKKKKSEEEKEAAKQQTYRNPTNESPNSNNQIVSKEETPPFLLPSPSDRQSHNPYSVSSSRVYPSSLYSDHPVQPLTPVGLDKVYAKRMSHKKEKMQELAAQPHNWASLLRPAPNNYAEKKIKTDSKPKRGNSGKNFDSAQKIDALISQFRQNSPSRNPSFTPQPISNPYELYARQPSPSYSAPYFAGDTSTQPQFDSSPYSTHDIQQFHQTPQPPASAQSATQHNISQQQFQSPALPLAPHPTPNDRSSQAYQDEIKHELFDVLKAGLFGVDPQPAAQAPADASYMQTPAQYDQNHQPTEQELEQQLQFYEQQIREAQQQLYQHEQQYAQQQQQQAAPQQVSYDSPPYSAVPQQYVPAIPDGAGGDAHPSSPWGSYPGTGYDTAHHFQIDQPTTLLPIEPAGAYDPVSNQFVAQQYDPESVADPTAATTKPLSNVQLPPEQRTLVLAPSLLSSVGNHFVGRTVELKVRLPKFKATMNSQTSQRSAQKYGPRPTQRTAQPQQDSTQQKRRSSGRADASNNNQTPSSYSHENQPNMFDLLSRQEIEFDDDSNRALNQSLHPNSTSPDSDAAPVQRGSLKMTDPSNPSLPAAPIGWTHVYGLGLVPIIPPPAPSSVPASGPAADSLSLASLADNHHDSYIYGDNQEQHVKKKQGVVTSRGAASNNSSLNQSNPSSQNNSPDKQEQKHPSEDTAASSNNSNIQSQPSSESQPSSASTQEPTASSTSDDSIPPPPPADTDAASTSAAQSSHTSPPVPSAFNFDRAPAPSSGRPRSTTNRQTLPQREAKENAGIQDLSRVHMLFYRAKLTEQKKTQARAEKHMAEMRQCTFQPKIYKKKEDVIQKKKMTPEEIAAAHKTRLEQLHQTHQQTAEKLEAKRQAQKEAEQAAIAQLTFEPKVNNPHAVQSTLAAAQHSHVVGFETKVHQLRRSSPGSLRSSSAASMRGTPGTATPVPNNAAQPYQMIAPTSNNPQQWSHDISQLTRHHLGIPSGKRDPLSANISGTQTPTGYANVGGDASMFGPAAAAQHAAALAAQQAAAATLGVILPDGSMGNVEPREIKPHDHINSYAFQHAKSERLKHAPPHSQPVRSGRSGTSTPSTGGARAKDTVSPLPSGSVTAGSPRASSRASPASSGHATPAPAPAPNTYAAAYNTTPTPAKPSYAAQHEAINTETIPTQSQSSTSSVSPPAPSVPSADSDNSSPPPSASADASSSSSNSTGDAANADPNILLFVDIQLSADQTDRIVVRRGEALSALAADFTQRHNLAPEYVPVIQDMLQQQVDKLVQQ